MYYEETVIDGVLCWRGTPDGAWIARSRQELTATLLEARLEIQSLKGQLCAINSA